MKKEIKSKEQKIAQKKELRFEEMNKVKGGGVNVAGVHTIE